VDHSEGEELPFCFGYHPYLHIDNEDLKDLTLTTDIATQLELKEVLIFLLRVCCQSSPINRSMW
jgi:hypothetical protein